MSESVYNAWKKIFLVLNPAAGRSNVDVIRQSMDNLCEDQNWICDVYETAGEEDLAEVVRSACQKGADLVVTAGGDGTVWGACNGLIKSRVPLAILPVGTGNGLARALKIPLQVETAINLLSEDNEVIKIDALKAGGRYFVLNVGAGISARTMQETPAASKQQAGILAYIATIVKDFNDWRQMSTFHLNLDGHDLRVRAAEVLVSNAVIGKNPPFFLYGERDGYQDGSLAVNILTAEKPGEFINLAWELLLDPDESKTNLQEFSVKTSISVDVEGTAMAVQGDGEMIGETPIEIHLVPKAVRVVVPRV